MAAHRPHHHAFSALAVVVAGLFLAGCATSALKTAPQDPAQPWTPEAGPASPGAAGAAEASDKVFSVPADPDVAQMQPTPGIDPRRAYGLPELIDIAQMQNPQTRIAWQQARQAALSTGMVEATYLPFISANVIGGWQDVSSTLPVTVGSVNQVSSRVEGVSPQVALQWLVFDFGQRDALHKAARHNASAANILFNGAHQKIIHDVTRAYFLYGAARSRVRIAEQNATNARKISAAAQARNDQGRGTTVEVAQGRQLVAQAQFGLVQAQGAERDSYQLLMGAMGVSPLTRITVREPRRRALPASVATPTEEMIKAALARRPDVLASFSAMKATRSAVGAAEAEFMPKVFLGAVAAGGGASFSATGLPTIGQQASTTGVLLGVTMPLYDGGLRAAQLKKAEALASTSEATFEATRDAAAREIVIAADTLRSALASYRAATALAEAAAVTYDAALDAYESGVGDITAATTAESGLLTARLAQSDAHAASLVAAANLAFVLGAMTSREVPAALDAR